VYFTLIATNLGNVSMKDTSQPQVFLSYASEDLKEVKKLYKKLSDAGYNPWMAREDILGGQNWENTIEQAIQKSDFFIACLSLTYVNKRGVLQKELRFALEKSQKMLPEDIYLIPVLFDDCKIPDELKKFQYIDLRARDYRIKLEHAFKTETARRIHTQSTKTQSPVDESPVDKTMSQENKQLWKNGKERFYNNCGLVVQLLQDVHNIPDDFIYTTQSGLRVPFLLRKENIFESQVEVDSILAKPLGGLFNGTIKDEHEKENKFVCERIENGKIYCARSNFPTILQKNDALSDELFIFLGRQSTFNSKTIENGLRKRLMAAQNVHEIDNPSLNSRIAGIGILCLTVVADENTFRGSIMRRSNKVAFYKKCYHVVPSAMFDSLTRSYDNEFSVRHTVFREIMEEIFNDEELHDIDKTESALSVPFNFFYDKAPLADLLKMLNNGSAILTLLGVGIDLLNLRPEIMVLLIIKDPTWMAKYRSEIWFNWEYANYDSGKQFRTIEEIKALLGSTRFAQWVPGGYVVADMAKNVLPGLLQQTS
jgi:hypothetical protein